MPQYAAAASLVLVLVVAGPAALGDERGSKDPLAEEIARWSTFLRDTESSDENWKDLKQSIEPAMARVETALKDGAPPTLHGAAEAKILSILPAS